MPKEKSAGAVVFREDEGIKYLLLHYAGGHWEFVKGHIEKGEEEKQTVMRELEEETAITKADFIDGFKEEIKYFFRRKDATVFKQVVFYLLKSEQKKVELSFEHIGYKWLDLRSALKILTFPNSKKVLKKADDFIKKNLKS